MMSTWITWLRGFSIRSRLLACMALVVAIGTLVGTGTSWQLLQLQGNLDDFAEREFAGTQHVGELTRLLGLVRSHEQAAIINTGDSVTTAEHFKQWKDNLAKAQATLAEIGQVMPDPKVDEEVKAIGARLKAYSASLTPTLELINASAVSSSAEAFQSSAPARAEAEAMEAVMAKLIADVEASAQARRDQTSRTVHQSIIALWVMLLAPGLVFLPLMGLSIASITIPLKRAESITQAIAHGDLTYDISPKGKDEIARVMLSMQTMQQGLRAMVAAVRESSESMLTASTEIAVGNQDLSSRTEHTASSLQQTASSMSELSDTVDKSALSATEANRLADTASHRAVHGGEVVGSVVQQMDEISQASRQIADIISVIDGIAFQTNILALNAAVEAARAGEQGRGFAVVAGEVRSLAQRSAEAAKEIKTLIGQSVDRVEVGAKRVKDAGSVMQEIVHAIQSVTVAMGEIADTTRQQAQGISQVTTSVNDLDQMTQQNAALVEQSAAAADSLRQQAQGLSQTVARFKLQGAPALA
jgi:methyl-accepting chemotaxis protein